MVSRLVLVRHAKAQTRSENVPDLMRELTKAGRLGIEARYPMTFGLLSDVKPDDIRIWSSPAIRALQTAEVVARALDVSGIEVKEELYSEDPAPILDSMQGEKGTLVIVGHNPFMEDLYESLSGEFQHFGKGAAASFSLQELDEGENGLDIRLEWFVQGPRSASWRTMFEMEKTFKRAAHRIEENYRWVLDEPDDPESLHQYRISLRVARSLLKLAKPYCKKSRIERLGDELKELQAPTSRVRELDMLVAALERGTREMAICSAACDEERAEFIKELKRKGTRRRIKRVTDRLANIPWSTTTRAQGISPQALAARVQKMGEACSAEMDAVVFEDHESVHDVRKHVKALRYITREFAACLPEDAGQRSAQAKAVQDNLGELCDCRNNIRLVEELCEPQAVGTLLIMTRQEDAIVALLDAQR